MLRETSQPTTNAAARATAIWMAMRVLAGSRRREVEEAEGVGEGEGAVRPASGRATAALAATVAAGSSCPGPMRSSPSTSRATATHSTATAPAAAVSSAAAHHGVPEAAGTTGTISTAVSGSAMRAPSRAANGPKRRSQIGTLIPAM